MTRRIRFLLPCVLLASASLSGLAAAQSPSGAPGLTSTSVMSGREGAWDMAFLPDGTMFFTEKCGGLSVRLPSGAINALLGVKDSKGFPETASDLFCSRPA